MLPHNYTSNSIAHLYSVCHLFSARKVQKIYTMAAFFRPRAAGGYTNRKTAGAARGGFHAVENLGENVGNRLFYAVFGHWRQKTTPNFEQTVENLST